MTPMGQFFTLCVAVAVAVVAGATAMAGNSINEPTVGLDCVFGSCFVPAFLSLADSNSYSGPAARRVEFADCCVPGDTYKVILRGPRAKSTTRWTATGNQSNGCITGPYLDGNASELAGGATDAKIIPLSLPGGLPASAYIRMSTRVWIQTKGQDSCGW